MKNLQNLEVKELNLNEAKEIEGGFFGIDDFIAGAILGGLLYDGLKWPVCENNEAYGRMMMASGSAGGAK